MKHSKGFTLIELLVVISIIGVLSSVVLAAVSTARSKGQVAAGLTFSDHTKAALYPTDNSTAYVYLDFNSALSYSSSQNNGPTVINNGPTGGSVASIPVGVSFQADTTLHKIGQYMQMPATYAGSYLTWTDTGTAVSSAISGGNFTYAFWFNPNGGVCGQTTCPMVWNDSAGGWTTSVNIGNNGAITTQVYGGSNIINSGYTLPSTNQWTHIAFSVKKAGGNLTGTLYINGNIVNTNTISAPTAVSDGTVNIGGACCTWGVNGEQFDDVAFYGQTLLSDDIHKIYAESLPAHLFAMSK